MASGRIYHWEFERHGEILAIDVPGALTLDESGLMLQAALSGAGLAYLAEAAVADHLANCHLNQVLGDWTPPYEGGCASIILAAVTGLLPVSWTPRLGVS
jgi:DNA-binding transcriptional LysR family regulator